MNINHRNERPKVFRPKAAAAAAKESKALSKPTARPTSSSAECTNAGPPKKAEARWFGGGFSKSSKPLQIDRDSFEAAQNLIGGILGTGSGATLTKASCKAALHEHQSLGETVQQLEMSLKVAKAQKGKAGGQQVARMQIEASEKRWTIAKLENDTEVQRKRNKELEDRLKLLESRNAVNTKEEAHRFKKEAATAQQKIAVLEKTIIELKKKATVHEERNDRGESEGAVAKRVIADLQRDMKLKESRCAELEEIAKELEDDKRKSQLNCNLAEQTLMELEHNVEVERSRNVSLENQIKRLEEETAVASEHLESEKDRARQIIAQLESDLEVQESINAELEHQVSELEEQKIGASELAARLQTEAAHTEWTIAKLESDCRLHENRNDELENQVHELRGMSAVNANVQAKSLELENWLREVKQKDKSQEKQDKAESAESAILRSDLDQCRRELSDAKRKIELMDRQLEATCHGSTDVVLHADDVAHLESIIQQNVFETQKLERQLEECRNQAQEQLHEVEKIAEGQLAECRGQLTIAEGEIEQMTKRIALNEEMINKVPELESEIQNNRSDNVKLTGKLASAESVIEYLTTRLVESRELTGQMLELKNIALQKAVETESMASQLFEAKAEIEYVKTKLPQDLAEKVPELEALIQHQGVEIERLEVLLDAYREQLGAGEDMIESLTAKLKDVQKLEFVIVDLEYRVQEKMDESHCLEGQLEDYRGRLSVAVSEIEALTAMQQETREFDCKISKLESIVTFKNAEIERLQVQLVENQNQLSEAEAMIKKLESVVPESHDLVTELEDTVLQMAQGNRQAELEELQVKLSTAEAQIEGLTTSLLETRVSLAQANTRKNGKCSTDTKPFQTETARKIPSEERNLVSGALLEPEISRLNDLIEDLEGQLAFTDGKNESLSKELLDTQRSLKQANAKVNYLESQNFFFDDGSEDWLQESSPVVSLLQEQVSEAQAAVKRNGDEVLELTKVVERKNIELAELTTRLDQDSRDSAVFRSKIKEFGAQVIDGEQDREALKESLLVAEDSLKKTQELVQHLESEVTRLRKAEVQLEKASATLESLGRELEKVKSRSDEKDSCVDKVEVMEVQVRELELEKEQLSYDIDELQNQLSSALSENTKLAENSVQLERMLNEVILKKNQLEQDVVLLKRAEQKCAGLEREVAMLKEAEQLAAEEFSTVTSQKRELSETKSKLTHAELLLEQIPELEERLQQEVLENENLHDLLEGFRRKLSEADEQVGSLSKQLDNAKKDAVDEARDCESKKDILISSLRQELEVAKSRADKAHQNENVARLQDEVKDLQAQLTTSRTSLEELKQELQFSRAKASELSDMLNTHFISGFDLEEKHQTVIRELAKVVAERDQLNDKLRDSRAKSRTMALDNEKNGHSWDAAVSKNENIHRLQEENDRSVRRATDLSVQLANSQMQIDQLLEQLKKTRQLGTTTNDLNKVSLHGTKAMFTGAATDFSSLISKKFSHSFD
jgi:chromosome segregation ATPase